MFCRPHLSTDCRSLLFVSGIRPASCPLNFTPPAKLTRRTTPFVTHVFGVLCSCIIMSSRITTLLKLMLFAPVLVSARPGHPFPRSNSDFSTSAKPLASPEQITPYPILWPYPSMPPRYYTPTDPRNEETRWGNPVELQQPDHTRGLKEDLPDNPAPRPDDGRDWWDKDGSLASAQVLKCMY